MLELATMAMLQMTHDQWYALPAWERSKWVSYQHAKQVAVNKAAEWLSGKDGNFNEFSGGFAQLLKFLSGDYA